MVIETKKNDDLIVGRIREIIGRRKGISERKMFGGTCFMVDGKMLGGTMGGKSQGDLIMRVSPEDAVVLAKKADVKLMKHGGRKVQGFVLVSPKAYDTKAKLQKWLERSINFVSGLPKKK